MGALLSKIITPAGLGKLSFTVVLAIFAGLGLFINTIKNIFLPPKQTSPPLWVIILGAVIVIMMFKKK